MGVNVKDGHRPKRRRTRKGAFWLDSSSGRTGQTGDSEENGETRKNHRQYENKKQNKARAAEQPSVAASLRQNEWKRRSANITKIRRRTLVTMELQNQNVGQRQMT